MIYKCTLLKDLPDFPSGTVFTVEDDKDAHYGYRIDVKNAYSLLQIINRPDWVRKEVHIEKCTDLACPKCKSTKGVFHTERTYENDDGVYYRYAKVSFECICGHVRVLGEFTAHSSLSPY